MYRLTREEETFLRSLNSPTKIQDYLDSLSFNFERDGETCMSPRRVMKARRAHCIEGAMLACTALMLHGERPLVMSLKVEARDVDHVVALYRKNGHWGAISKTNHAVLRFRDPVYRSIRELAMSYFHEYFLVSDGTKTMRGYSQPINLRRFGTSWVTNGEDLWHIAEYIYDHAHEPVIPDRNRRYIRSATEVEQAAAGIEATQSVKR